MIIFYEGLPRSGKSLNAIKEYVVPMLKKGRSVYAYIEGLNHEQIAKLAEIDYDKCIDLLIPIQREDVLNWFKTVPNDAFIVLDEIQNFYPNSRKQLDQEVIQAIAEHGHNGLDILLMGQVFSDVHKTWLGRCAQRVLFMKREAAGKPDEFTQIIYKPVVNGDKIKWQELRRIKGIPYDKAYFGAYKSHTDDTDNTETLIDDRANVWNNPIVKRWLPLFGLVALSSLGYLFYMFMGGGLQKSITAKPETRFQQVPTMSLSQMQAEAQLQQKPPPTQIVQPQPVQPVSTPQQTNTPNQTFESIDEVVELNKLGRIRLSAYMKMGKRTDGIIEWIGGDFKVLQRVNFTQLKAMGYLVLSDSDGTIAVITNGINRFTATSWPVQDFEGHITQARQLNIAAGGVI